MKDFFANRLHAPLKNQRWAWGAIDDQGRLFLRVWRGEFKQIDGQLCCMLFNQKAFEFHEGKSDGWAQRAEHIELMKTGVPTFLVNCNKQNPNGFDVQPVRDFDRETLFVGGKVFEYEGDVWCAVVDRLPVEQICG
jgi:hypothetical protein